MPVDLPNQSPPRWTRTQLGNLGAWSSGGTPSKARADYWLGNIPWVSPKDMKRFVLDDTEDHVSDAAATSGTRLVPAGSVFIVVRGMILAHTFPVCVAARPMTFNQDVKAIVPNGTTDGRFVAHWLNGRSDALLRLVTEATHGTKRLEQAELKAFGLDLPPLSEQRQIATILDTVDDAIRKTEQIIAKLKQVKQGLLHDLLTCGIDDNGELRNPERHPEQFKDSPLGRTPKGWEVVPLGHALSRIEAGKSPSCPDRPAQGNDWGVLKVSAVRPTGFQANENKVIVNPAHIDAALEVQHGDLLITRANTYELVGLTCLVEQPPPRLMLCDKTLRLVIDTEKADARFIFFTTQMPYVRAQIEICATGSSGSMKNIGQGAIRSLRIRLAPPLEQGAIAAQLSALDNRHASEVRSLAAARMVKAGLMEDLLAGRVRVTNLLESQTE
jgi:type I restriction enzyme S subunit